MDTSGLNTSGMDNFSGLLEEHHARGAFALRAVMQAPWSIQISAESPLALIAGVSGDVWILPMNAEPLRLGPGDLVITRGSDHYKLADSPDRPASVIVNPGQHCCDLSGKSVSESMLHDVRTWGNDPQGDTVFLVGAYENLSEISDRLARLLPPVVSLPRDTWQSPLLPLLAQELVKDEPGQAAVLDRLLDLLLTAGLKAWFARQDKNSPEWWLLQGDRIVEKALRAMQEKPAHPWTLDSLASTVGASRSSLARRFQNLVGEPPMTFLKNWRMALAADLLCQPNENVASVAGKVGYATPFAFSTAFKRVRGISPQQYRSRMRQQG